MSLDAIVDISGLYISDISISRSTALLREHGITHVLSLTNQRDRPEIAEELGIQHQHLEIEDNPFEDLLMSLEGICAWIDDAFANAAHEPRVLVHCLQGISRSGAIIVAYLMRGRSLDYDAALALARESRTIIAPNSGFSDQLRLWKEMDFSIYETDCEDVGRIKPRYDEWRSNRGILLSREDEARQEVVRKSMADMVAKFGRRTLDVKERRSDERNLA